MWAPLLVNFQVESRHVRFQVVAIFTRGSRSYGTHIIATESNELMTWKWMAGWVWEKSFTFFFFETQKLYVLDVICHAFAIEIIAPIDFF